MPSTRVTFENSSGLTLVGVLDRPADEPRAFAVFSHCFTCSKDLKAIVRVSRNLVKQGIAVLRFDFAGVGESGGRFADSNFESNVADLKSAIGWLTTHHSAPQLLIGHSLGGAAAMAVAADAASSTEPSLADLRSLVTLAAPSDTSHLAEFLVSQNSSIESTGQGDVNIGGRPWPITQQLINSLRSRELPEEIKRIRLPHLILHSPEDQTVAWRHALKIQKLTGGPSSLVTIDGADHLLLNQKDDVQFVADLIAVWSQRYFKTLN